MLLLRKLSLPRFNENGMTLIEAVMTAGISGFLILIAGTMLSLNASSKQQALFDADRTNLQSELQMQFSTPASCSTAFKLGTGLLSINPNSYAATNISIYNPDGTLRFTNGNAYNSVSVSVNGMAYSSNLNVTKVQFVSVSAGVDAQAQNWEYTQGNIQLTVVNPSPNAIQSQLISIPITFKVSTTAANKVVACSSVDPDGLTPIRLPVCTPGQVLVFKLPATTRAAQWACTNYSLI